MAHSGGFLARRYLDSPTSLQDVREVLKQPPAGNGKFKLATSAWVIWGLYTAVRLGLVFVRGGSMQSEEIGAVAGEAVGFCLGILIVSLVFAHILHRVTGRSGTAGNTAFYVIFGLTVLGQLGSASKSRDRVAALQELRDEQQSQKAAAARGQPVEKAKTKELYTKANEVMGSMAQSSDEAERTVGEAGQEFLQQAVVAREKAGAACLAVRKLNLWHPNQATSGVSAKERRQAVLKLIEAVDEFGRYSDVNGTAMRRIMAAHHVPDGVAASMLAGYQRGQKEQILLTKARSAYEEICGLMLSSIKLAEDSRGHWKLTPNGMIQFDSQDLLDRYMAILKRRSQLSTIEAAYEKVLLEPA